MSNQERKRASVRVPLSIVAAALGLPPGLHIEFASQNPQDVAMGNVQLLIGGDQLDPCFLTPGPAASAQIEYTDGEDGPSAHIVPIDQKPQ